MGYPTGSEWAKENRSSTDFVTLVAYTSRSNIFETIISEYGMFLEEPDIEKSYPLIKDASVLQMEAIPV